MAQAVKSLFPEAKLAIGPAIEDGFTMVAVNVLYPEDLEKISSCMQQIIAQDLPFERKEVTRDQARAILPKVRNTR